MQEIRQAEQQGTLPELARQFSLGHKPVEELYDLRQDPDEVHNLATDPAYAERLASMRRACLEWQAESRDLGLVPEAEIEIREARAGSRFDILHEDGNAEMVMQLVEVAAAASDGADAIPTLRAALDNSDAAVRYWGATGLGNIGPPARSQAEVALTRSLTDESPNVRIAAARGLCRLGDPSAGLPVLETELASKHQWGRLAAAIALDELDEAARPALPALQAALSNQPNKYIVRVANKAVNDLLGTNNRVP